jgi:AsmA-like C-terminal region
MNGAAGRSALIDAIINRCNQATGEAIWRGGPGKDWTMNAAARIAPRKRGLRITEMIIIGVVTVVLVSVDLMFYFWPFRYRQVHPLLQQVFQSRVDVKSYHRTYFPHPGFVAEDVTFYRHGDTHIPPLATVKRMTVAGQWLRLIFHPHTLYQIRLEGLHVQIPPPGTTARGMDFDNGVISTSNSKLRIQTILADGTTLDFLRHQGAPLRFEFKSLVIHNVENKRPLEFAVRVNTQEPHGTVVAMGVLGPFRTSSYGTTPMSGTYSLVDGDLNGLAGMSGHPVAGGRFGGIFSNMDVRGNVAIPDFRVASGQAVRLDAAYHVTVSGTNGDVEIENAIVKTGTSMITASGSVAGSPKRVAITIESRDSQVADLLKIVEKASPQVEGDVSFRAAVDFGEGPGRFLEKLNLKGDVSLDEMKLAKAETQQKVDAFSARVRNNPPEAAKGAGDAPEITLTARSATRFEHGMAYFPDIHASLPGADAHLHGTFNLLDTRIHLTGNVALEKGISHAATGWKSALLKPLTPLFRKKDAGAVVPIAVTGTAAQPKVGADVLHDK